MWDEKGNEGLFLRYVKKSEALVAKTYYRSFEGIVCDSGLGNLTEIVQLDVRSERKSLNSGENYLKDFSKIDFETIYK